MSNNDINIYGKFNSRLVGGALMDDMSIIGSYHTVSTILDRNNIPEQVRKSGMAVYVSEISSLYILGQDLSNDSWILFNPFEDFSLIIVADKNLSVNTIALSSDDDTSILFEDKQAVFVIKSNSDNSIVRLYGYVKPTNLPINAKFGNKIYINEFGILTTNMELNMTYKHIGNIIVENTGDLILALISDQTNYKIE